MEKGEEKKKNNSRKSQKEKKKDPDGVLIFQSELDTREKSITCSDSRIKHFYMVINSHQSQSLPVGRWKSAVTRYTHMHIYTI